MDPASLTTALTVGVVLVIAFFALRVILKITHIVFTLGCLAVIVLAVLFVFFGGLPFALP